MIDPGLSEPSEGVRVSMENSMRLNDELSAAQMPPYIRISHAARGHGEKTQSKNNHEQAAGLKKLSQASRIIPRVGITSVSFASRNPKITRIPNGRSGLVYRGRAQNRSRASAGSHIVANIMPNAATQAHPRRTHAPTRRSRATLPDRQMRLP